MKHIPLPTTIGGTEQIKVHIVPYACSCNIYVSIVTKESFIRTSYQLWQYTTGYQPRLVGRQERMVWQW